MRLKKCEYKVEHDNLEATVPTTVTVLTTTTTTTATAATTATVAATTTTTTEHFVSSQHKLLTFVASCSTCIN